MTRKGWVAPPRTLTVAQLGSLRRELTFARNLAEAAGDTSPQACWEWPSRLNGQGYGQTTVDGHTLAHRAVYERLVGPIPDGLELDHLCRNRRCCNPWHLEPVTHAENVRRGSKAQQTHCVRGHEFTPDNTGYKTNGCRICVTCRREWQRQWDRRHRAKRVRS